MKYLNLNQNEFRLFIKNKKCICFGAGLQGIRFIHLMENWKKVNDIVAFIDNNIEKQGKTITLEEYRYPIISLNEALKIIEDDIVIIITCLDFYKIKEQLNQYKELETIDGIIMVEIAKNQLLVSDYEVIKHDCKEAIIPKKIHYCWFGGEKLDFVKKNIEQWKQMCPDYEIMEWNESNYDVTKCLYTKQAYDDKAWSFVSDYARLDVLYRYGGIYLDTDVEIVQKPDELLYQKAFTTFDASLFSNTAIIGTTKNNLLIKELRDYYDNIEYDILDNSLNRFINVTYTYNVLKKYGMVLNDGSQMIRGMNIYPMVFQGTCFYTRQMKITDKTFFLHYGTMTWLKERINCIKKERVNREKSEEQKLDAYELM